MILEFDGTARIVSHDRWCLDRLATSILAFEGQATLRRYHGNYSDYLEAVTARNKREAPRSKSVSSASTRRPASAGSPESAAARKLTHAERRELDGLMPRIEAAEAEIAALETRLADSGSYAGGGEGMRKLLRRLDDAKAQAAELIARWEELEERSAYS